MEKDQKPTLSLPVAGILPIDAEGQQVNLILLEGGTIMWAVTATEEATESDA